jgi:hypothetical protein
MGGKIRVKINQTKNPKTQTQLLATENQQQ